MKYTPETLDRELAGLRLPHFDYADAWQIGCLMQSEAKARKLPVAITIAHGIDVVFSTVLPGGTPDNLAWAARKRAVANRFHRSSLALRLEAEAGNFDFNARYLLPPHDFIASGGGVPLILADATLIGSIGVSGLPDIEDHLIATNAIRSFIASWSG